MQFEVEVTFVVDVEVDQTKFTPEFLAEFRKSLYPFDFIDHVKHIAQLEAREMLSPDFTEGYGALKEMGIKAAVTYRFENITGPQ